MKSHVQSVSVVALLAFAGLAAHVGAQSQPMNDQPNSQNQTNRQNNPNQNYPNQTMPRTNANGMQSMQPHTFRFASDIRGYKVENGNRDHVGNIDDVVIERGSGRVAYVILSAGGFLGIGSKQVAVPYSAFGWNAADKKFVLDTTKEQVKTWPEFNKDTWIGGDTSLSNRLWKSYYNDSNNNYPAQATTDGNHVIGKITRIDRRDVGTPGSEEMLVTVTTQDGREQQVVVGPSWYLAGNTLSLYRGAPVDMVVTQADRNGQQVELARSVSIDSRQVSLYDDRGNPSWSGNGSNNMTGSNMSGSILLLSKDLQGKRIEARGERFGKVDDLIIDCANGRVAFLSIDPDQAILGMGDTKRMIPWGVLIGTSNDAIMIDATKAMVTSAPITPRDLEKDNYSRDIYRGYDVRNPYDTYGENGNSRQGRDLPDPSNSNRNNNNNNNNPRQPK
ncbi:MAG: PRC-barrel domain-containing protein [Phycisphaerales bacterium]